MPLPDRMPQLDAAQMDAAQKAAFDEIVGGRRGALYGPFVPALRSPEFMRRLQRLGEYLRYDSALPPHLREMAILLVAREWTQDFEWSVHAPMAREAGLPGAVIDGIAAGTRPAEMDTPAALVFDFVAELQRTRGVSDATYAKAVAAFGERGVIDLVGTCGYYATLAMIMNVARTPLPAGEAPVLPTLPR